tara:strand:+ start:1602 stop:2735 length:1134 start_codon:yes stop_codon:yes gene_type:complete
MCESMEYEMVDKDYVSPNDYSQFDEEADEIEKEVRSIEDLLATTLKIIKTETMKESTLKTYSRLLRKLYSAMKDHYADSFLFHKECPKEILFNPKAFMTWLEDKPYGVKLSERSLKNYLSLILSLVRNYKQDGEEFVLAYDIYFQHFNTIKNSLNAEQEKQLPKEKEISLKGVSMDTLRTYMNHWAKKCKGVDNTDCYSGYMYALGHIHLDQVLRNELADMTMSKDYLPAIDYPKTNFIWNKGRNAKLLVIRQNKVRNPDRNDPPKEVWLKGKVNTAINKYIQILHRCDIFMDSPIPFSWGIKEKCCVKQTSSNYSQNFRKLFTPYCLPISTTDLRKIYAMDIRKQHGGNLIKEKEACEKLDHSKDTHDKHYILDFA